MRELVFHKPCSIVKGLIDAKVIPSEIVYPLTLRVNEFGLFITSEAFLPFFLEV